MALVRRVTDESVGELGRRYFWRPNAERDVRVLNSAPPEVRPVEYVVERRGWLVFAIVAYQAKLEEA